MRLTIRGCARTQRPILRNCVLWLTKKFFRSDLSKNLTVQITIKRQLDSPDECGECEWVDENARPRKFNIAIKRGQPFREILLTLVHEMVHLRQFARNELFDYTITSDRSRWHTKVVDTSKTAYRDLPWEREAYGEQRALLYEWARDTDQMRSIRLIRAKKNKVKPKRAAKLRLTKSSP